jgi:hypothetical protein
MYMAVNSSVYREANKAGPVNLACSDPSASALELGALDDVYHVNR